MLKTIAFVTLIAYASAQCNWSPTTASGSHAPGQICAGDLIFEDNFDFLDFGKWEHEINSDGGGNNEFQDYVNDRANSWTDGGILNIRPTLNRAADGDFATKDIPNPINSARLRSKGSFSFKFGRLETLARMPAGDWIWPAIWMMPEESVYGEWPRSGEIDIVESRGNRNLILNGINIGVEQIGSTMHFGPQWNVNGWPTAHYTRNQPNGWHVGFHRYQLEWTPERIRFSVDDIEIGTVNAGSGFWDRGGFQGTGLPNPWTDATVMAPFDQEFHMILNVAVGGTFFPDAAQNPGGKPWSGSSPNPREEFWNGRSQWLPTWNQGSSDSQMQIQYVRVWAL